MEHNRLNLEYDRNLINKVLDDIEMRYIILFLYIIRNDLFENLKNQKIIDSYQRVLFLDEVYKGNILTFWENNFLEVAIDLGLIRNIRSIREFEMKEHDFIIKFGDNIINVEENTIIVSDELLFLIIQKKFKFLTKRNFNLAITRLKSVRCESTSAIHPFIYEIGEESYCISDDLYDILDQYGNIYQSIKIEVTIEGFFQRFKETFDKITDFIEIFDPTLNNKNTIKKIKKAIEEDKDIIKYLKDEKIKLSDKLEADEIDKNASIYIQWNSILLDLLKYRDKLEEIDNALLKIKNYYSGKKKSYSYLEFIEKVSFNDDNIVNNIQNELISLREKIIEIDKEISKLTKKEIKLLNLDFERFLLTSGDD